jgi:hypothetical protein
MSTRVHDRITLEELAVLLRDAARSILESEGRPRARRDVSAVDLEELGRLMLGELWRQRA